MSKAIHILLVVGAFMILWATFRNLKRHKLSPSYSILWIGIAFFIFSLSVFSSFYQQFAVNIMGLTGGEHLAYAGALFFLIVYSFYLTTKISQISQREQRLISTVAILDLEIGRLKNKGGSQ